MATMEYLGPADALVVGDKTYTRPVGGSVTVQIDEAVARRMAGSATHHRFRMGDKELRIADAAEQRGDVPVQVAAPVEGMGDAGGAPLVEAKVVKEPKEPKDGK